MLIKGDYSIPFYLIRLVTTEFIHDMEHEKEDGILYPENERTIVIYAEKERALAEFDRMDIYEFFSMYNLPDVCSATLILNEYLLVPYEEAQNNGIIKHKDLLENIDWKEVNDFINKGK